MQEYFQLVLYWEVCPLYGVSSFWSALYRRFHCSDLKLTRRTYNMCVMSQTIQSPFLLCSSQPEQFQQKAGASANGAWGSPMATSTQMAGGGGGGGGGGYAGARQDSGLTPLQQQCLNMISGCPHEQGLNIKEVVGSLVQHGHSDVKIR